MDGVIEEMIFGEWDEFFSSVSDVIKFYKPKKMYEVW